MIPNLYIVDYPNRSDYAEAAVIKVEYDYDKCVHCPQCGDRVSGAYWKRPREVVLTKRNAPDFLYAYCDNVPFVISEKALEIIRQAGLTGIEKAEEIEFVRYQRNSKKEIPIPKYYHIELSRSRMTIDHTHSVISYGSPYGSAKDAGGCSLCRQVPRTYDFFRSLAFHTDKYEGYDIFQTYEMCNTVFLSQRFVDVCKANDLTNLRFDPAQKHGQWTAAYFLDGNEDV